MNKIYLRQVGLLMNVLPEVARESCFALYGGTAINFFVLNMPRLSIDIDLTYTQTGERQEALTEINAALLRVKESIGRLSPSIRIQHKPDECRLQVEEDGVVVKVEANMVMRGLLGEITQAELCGAAQEEFDTRCVMPLVPVAQIYGGKICAALDRQHPRDLFDVKLLLEGKSITSEIKRGFVYGLVSSNRPAHEMLAPNFPDHRSVFENHFEGMSAVEFTYDDFEVARSQLVADVNASLDENDKQFLLSLNRLEPDWSIYDFQDFPSVQWKLHNLGKFKQEKPDAYHEQLEKLETVLKLKSKARYKYPNQR